MSAAEQSAEYDALTEAYSAAIEAHLSTGLGCRCGEWKIDTSQRPVDPRAQHRRHVAEVLARTAREAAARRDVLAAAEALESIAGAWSRQWVTEGRHHGQPGCYSSGYERDLFQRAKVLRSVISPGRVDS